MPRCMFCSHIDLYNRRNEEEAYCNQLRRFFDVNNSGSCGYYIPSYKSGRQCELENEDAIQRCQGNSNSSSCFITTAVCDILNYPDDCLELNVLRYLRDEYMIPNLENRQKLIEYYVLGPLISKKMKQDPNKVALASNLYKTYLKPSVELVLDGKYQESVSYYELMVKGLKQRYHLETLKLNYGALDHLPTIKDKNDLKQLAKKITLK